MHADSDIRAKDGKVDADTDPQHLLLHVVYSDYVSTVRKQALMQDIADTTIATAKITVKKGGRGAIPAQLTDAMKPDPVPDDPFDGKPLRYRIDDKGFVIYSVGQDGKFDGGKPGKVKGRYDVLFRYPVPAYYAKEMSGK